MLQQALDKILRQGSLHQTQITPAAWQAVYSLPENFIAFQGHFPNYPILPAFMQICMTGHLLSRALRQRLHLTRIAVAKFTGVVAPGMNLQINCSCTEAPGSPAEITGWDCALKIESGSEVARFRLFFRSENYEN